MRAERKSVVIRIGLLVVPLPTLPDRCDSPVDRIRAIPTPSNNVQRKATGIRLSVAPAIREIVSGAAMALGCRALRTPVPELGPTRRS